MKAKLRSVRPTEIRRRRPRFSRKVELFLKSSRAENTVRAYSSDLRHFQKWGGRVPASPATVAEYLADLCVSRAFATIARRKAAIAAAHRERGYSNPCSDDVVRATLKGIRRRASHEQRQMRPLVAEQVIQAARSTGSDLCGIRDRALLLVGFAGAFRRSELVALDVEDCGKREGHLVIVLKRSKTDQEGLGREVVIPPGNHACPLRALLDWLKRANIRSGAVFRRIDREGAVGAERLRAEHVTDIAKTAARSLGLDPGYYGAHSLRAGYVTTAALAGVPLWEIKRQTGHSRETVLLTYIRDQSQRRAPALL